MSQMALGRKLMSRICVFAQMDAGVKFVLFCKEAQDVDTNPLAFDLRII